MALPLSDEEKNEIRRLHAAGKSCRQIADTLDRSPASVSTHAAAMGLTFDRSQTEAGSAAVAADNRARRTALVAWQYRRAQRLAERLDGDTFFTVTRSATNGAMCAELAFVPADDELNLSRAMGAYLKAAADLEKIDSGDGAEGAKGMLTDLLSRLRGAPQQ